MRYALATIFAGFILALCFAARADARCETQWYPEWRADVRNNNPGAPIVENVLSEGVRLEFVAAYNASPPESDERPSEVAIWVHMRHMQAHLSGQLLGGNTAPFALVVFIDETGCIASTQKIPLFVLDKLLRGVPFTQGGNEI